MRRIVPLLTVVVTVIAIASMPLASASASVHTGNPAATGTRPTVRALPSGARLVQISASSSMTCTGVGSSPGPCILCLTNASTYCAAFNIMDVVQAVLDSSDSVKVLLEWFKALKGDGGEEEEPEVEGEDSGGSTDDGLCLQSTGGNDSFAGCSANGTVWIEVPNGDGSYLINRYLYNQGIIEVLTVRATINGYHLYVASEGVSGTWQTWTWSNVDVENTPQS
jgi:hypothetical protein